MRWHSRFAFAFAFAFAGIREWLACFKRRRSCVLIFVLASAMR
jgi:hypothetical protein